MAIDCNCKCKKVLKYSKTIMILHNNCGKPQHSFVKFKDTYLENAKYINI